MDFNNWINIYFMLLTKTLGFLWWRCNNESLLKYQLLNENIQLCTKKRDKCVRRLFEVLSLIFPSKVDECEHFRDMLIFNLMFPYPFDVPQKNSSVQYCFSTTSLHLSFVFIADGKRVCNNRAAAIFGGKLWMVHGE